MCSNANLTSSPITETLLDMFARITQLTDVKLKGSLESQAIPGEIVEVFETVKDVARIKKADGVEGWIAVAHFSEEQTLEASFPKKFNDARQIENRIPECALPSRRPHRTRDRLFRPDSNLPLASEESAGAT